MFPNDLIPQAGYQALLEMGFLIIPCHPNQKQPLLKGWQKDASCDPNVIQRWWAVTPDANMGIPTGQANRVFVLDVDMKASIDGIATLAALEAAHAPLPQTLTATTPSGGRHLYFRYPEGGSIRNRAGFKPGLDIRGEGGFVVAPPSSIDGQHYVWTNPLQSIAEPPEWLLNEITRTEPRATNGHSSASRGYPAGTRNDSLFRLVCSRMAAGYQSDDTKQLALIAASQCEPPYPRDDVIDMVDRVYRTYAQRRPLTDLGNAERFLDAFGDRLKYVPELGIWMIWQDTCWELDGGPLIIELGKACVRSIAGEGKSEQDHDKLTQLHAHAKRGEKPQAIKNMLEFAATVPVANTPARLLDADKLIVGVQNGFVDLASGSLLPPEDRPLVTMSLGTPWRPDAQCPKWIAFLTDLFGADPELPDFLRTAVGYSLYGGNPSSQMFILHGRGANGKSTFLRVLQALFGSYSKAVDGSLFMVNRDSGKGGPREDLIRLRGARLIVSAELAEGQMINEELVKRMTGDDTMVARAPYAKNSIEFIPKFTPWISTNDKPIVRGDGTAIWRRLVLVPFTTEIPLEKRNPHLGDQLIEELPGILNWALAGFRTWNKAQRLELPPSIAGATAEYREEMDLLAEWLAACCEEQSDNWLSIIDLYSSYSGWCAFASENRPLDRRVFSRKLGTRGFKREKRSGTRGLLGLALSDEGVAHQLARFSLNGMNGLGQRGRLPSA